MSLVWLFGPEELHGDPSAVMTLYDDLVAKDYVWHSGKIGVTPWYRAYIANPPAIAFELTGQLVQVTKTATRPTSGRLIACQRTSVGYHFVVPEAKDQGAYNPDPSIPLDTPISYRVFT